VKRTFRFIAAPLADVRGATAIEYALLAGLIAAGLIGTAALFGDALGGVYAAVDRSLAAARAE
jgi:pilus assembly protein Flp/PilA